MEQKLSSNWKVDKGTERGSKGFSEVPRPLLGQGLAGVYWQQCCYLCKRLVKFYIVVPPFIFSYFLVMLFRAEEIRGWQLS